ncbi:MAG: hypothetical protein ACF8XB_25615 [Planctomycetota bacterium JB042]
MSKFGEYAFVFLVTGLSAVAIKALGELNQSKIAGVLSMIPVRSIAGLFILANVAGAAGVRSGLGGIAIGLVGLLAMTLAVHVSLDRTSTTAAIVAGLAAWFAVSAGLLVVTR